MNQQYRLEEPNRAKNAELEKKRKAQEEREKQEWDEDEAENQQTCDQPPSQRN
jgi:hypothetical protein